MYRVKGKTKGQKKKEDKYELALPEQNKPYRVEQTVFVYKKKKKAKGGNSGDDSAPAERARCGCQARLHLLVNNCVRCGRIVCTKEGAGPCFHCQAMVYAVSGEVAENVAAVAALEAGASQKEIAGLQKAQEHLGRLLEYDQNAVRRTTVYDDQADYFDMSKWLNNEERQALKEKEEAIIREKEARKNMITIDFAGRKVVTEEAEALKFEEEVLKQIAAGTHVAPKKAADSLLFNPSAMATGVRPTFVEPHTIQASSSSNEVKQKKKRKLVDDDEQDDANPTNTIAPNSGALSQGRNYARAVAPDVAKSRSSRVQHDFYPETDVQVSALDFDQLVADDKTPLTRLDMPLERRGVIFQKSFNSISTAKSVIQWLSSKKANVMVVAQSIASTGEDENIPDAVQLSQLNEECRAAGLVLSVGFRVPYNFEYGSEEAVAKFRSQIHHLARKHGVTQFVIFFSGELSAPSGFRSLAQAQCTLVNSTVKFFQRSSSETSSPALTWIVAPTRSFCSFESVDSDTTTALTYLRELDSHLTSDAVLLWNGPHKLPRNINLDHLKKLRGLLKHNTLLWERSPAKGSSLRGGSLLTSYSGRPAEIGCFSTGIMLTVTNVGDRSWMPFVGSALTFGLNPVKFSATDVFNAEVTSQFADKADMATAALELVEATPASFLRERLAPPSCLRLGTAAEVKYFARQREIAEKVMKHDSGAWAQVAEYVLNFSTANELFAAFEANGRKTDAASRASLTQALRNWGRLIEPASSLIKPLKASLFLHQIPDKSFVQEIQANFFKWEQQLALVRSHRSSRVPRGSVPAQAGIAGAAALKIEELETMLVEDLRDLEMFLIDAYNDDDLQAMRDYLNALHFDSTGKRVSHPPLTSGLAKQFNRSALDRFSSRLQRRRAEAAKKLASVAVMPDAAPESDKCEEVKNLQVPGLRYFKNWISPEEEATLLKEINTYPWSSALQRRTQQYGYIYDYGAVKSADVSESRLSMGPMMPPSLQRLADRLFRDKLSPVKADQCIVNEYLPGQGINPHIDHAASFQDCVVSISLGSDVVMDFRNLKSDEEKHLLLQRRSAIILTGDSRYHWQHGIASREVDQINGQEIRRAKRVSITFRKVSQQAIHAITKGSKR
eukprot:TRINITY_DN5902_c0_g2_i1.p1 TRINITY_DN5902_c0_g2~~TRINITY_DN5902_c0_g2_i1.p1  ORF type:complete len:1226 (+),score=223.02 TRINITY_DN5902_c0_g2_i1:308-3679(+)